MPVHAMSTIGKFRDINDRKIDGETEGQMCRKGDRWTYIPTDRGTNKINEKMYGQIDEWTNSEQIHWG